MGFGISVYAIDEFPNNKNFEYIKMAKDYGIEMVFTSMHLPEVDYKSRLKEIIEMIEFIKSLDMRLTVDVSPITMNILNASVDNITPFYNLGIDCLRLDYGFSEADISEMSKNSFGIELELNASTIKENQIEKIKSLGTDLKKIRTCHNFYPRPYTGLSYNFFKDKTAMIKKYGLKVGAFIPSQKGRRSPLYEGLPTIEEHRNIAPLTAAKYFIYTGMVDDIYFGDAYASLDELKSVTSIDNNIIEMDIVLNKDISEYEKDIIFLDVHTNRSDASEYIIRSEESRGYAKIGQTIQPNNTIERKKYSVTIDNMLFKRYSGELQICMTDLPGDERVNVIGYIPKEQHILADMIKPCSKFRFKKG